METIKEEIGADGRKKIYVRYTEQELAEMKGRLEKKSRHKFRKLSADKPATNSQPDTVFKSAKKKSGKKSKGKSKS